LLAATKTSPVAEVYVTHTRTIFWWHGAVLMLANAGVNCAGGIWVTWRMLFAVGKSKGCCRSVPQCGLKVLDLLAKNP
jgi:hypothetical protein